MILHLKFGSYSRTSDWRLATDYPDAGDEVLQQQLALGVLLACGLPLARGRGHAAGLMRIQAFRLGAVAATQDRAAVFTDFRRALDREFFRLVAAAGRDQQRDKQHTPM